MKLHSAIELSLYREIDDLKRDNKDLRKHLHNIISKLQDSDTEAAAAAREFLASRS